MNLINYTFQKFLFSLLFRFPFLTIISFSIEINLIKDICLNQNWILKTRKN